MSQEEVEVYRQPGADGYRQTIRSAPDKRPALALLPDVSVAIADLWS
ncbi:MAG TPA: hypothetical protein VNN62_20810 [Methylomirabilota bacterium]|nr:hypothetical protein [Methylomirabilota bacterium]